MSNPAKEAMISFSVVLDGVPITISTHATVDALPAMVRRLRDVGCVAPGEPAAQRNDHHRNGARHPQRRG